MSEEEKQAEKETVSKETNTEEKPEEQVELSENTADKTSEKNETVTDAQKEKDKYLRLFAEFENYKRRTSKERIELFATAGAEVIEALLPVLDDFERGLVAIEKTNDEETLKGVKLIQEKLIKTLEGKGLSKINIKQGDNFNADTHEAVTQIPPPSEDLKGKIIDVVEQGYKMGEKIIRYPKVVIGQS